MNLSDAIFASGFPEIAAKSPPCNLLAGDLNHWPALRVTLKSAWTAMVE